MSLEENSVIIDNGDEIPEYLFEALGIDFPRDRKIGKIVVDLEDRHIPIADAIREIMQNKRLKRVEKFYAVYRMGSRQKEAFMLRDSILTEREQAMTDLIGGKVLKMLED